MSSYVAYRGPSTLDPSVTIMAIVTLDSANSKTGPMAQLFIVPQDEAPHIAQKTGLDAAVCGDCPFRPLLAKANGLTPCYVRVFQAARSTWQRNAQEPVQLRLTCKRLTGATLRLGAYGDPAALPESVIRALATAVDNRVTGYSHRWKDDRFAYLKAYVMASCDAPHDYARAKAEGWRTFRVIQKRALPVLAAREIICPSDVVQCIVCRLCDGSQSARLGASYRDKRKDIAIMAH